MGSTYSWTERARGGALMPGGGCARSGCASAFPECLCTDRTVPLKARPLTPARALGRNTRAALRRPRERPGGQLAAPAPAGGAENQRAGACGGGGSSSPSDPPAAPRRQRRAVQWRHREPLRRTLDGSTRVTWCECA
eukprot:366278-Chlamydomonas_euryale.AAC.6